MSDYIYFPIYDALFAGLGTGALIGLVCVGLCAIGLYAFLALTEPQGVER